MNQRTPLQNKALHKYFSLLAEALNDAGYDMRKTLKADIEIPWTEENIKNHLWRPIQISMTGKQSTIALDTAEPGQIYEVLNKHLGEKLGVNVPFPCDEPPMIKERDIR